MIYNTAERLVSKPKSTPASIQPVTVKWAILGVSYLSQVPRLRTA